MRVYFSDFIALRRLAKGHSWLRQILELTGFLGQRSPPRCHERFADIVQQSLLVSVWGPTTFYLNGGLSLDPLKRRNVEIERDPVVELVGEQDRLSAVRFADGRSRPVDAFFISPRNHLNSNRREIGCDAQEGPLGQFIAVVDRKMTTVAGVYAAGDITRTLHNITFACADGVMAAMAIHRSLVLES